MKKLLATVLMIGVVAAVATAGTISYTASLGLTDTTWNFGAGNTVALPQFDKTLFLPQDAVLAEITVELTGIIATDLTVDNTHATNGGTYNAQQGADVSVQGPGASITVSTTPLWQTPGFSAQIPLAAGAQDTYGIPTPNTTTDVNSGNVAASFFNLYEGNGTVTFDTQALGAAALSGFTTQVNSQGGTISGTGDVDANASIKITYRYIPEPSTFALLGLMGVAGLVRRKRR